MPNIQLDDGVESKREVEIEAELLGVHHRFTIPASEFTSMNWPIEKLGTAAIVFPNQKEYARTAIQSLSLTAKEQRIYTHTGWREIQGEWAYLHAGGAIAANGAISGTNVRLWGTLNRYHLPSPNPGGIKLALAATLQLLELAPPSISFPLLAATFRAVIGSADFSLHVAGATGTFKSEIVALHQQFFGDSMKRMNLPGSWSSTANALEALSFYAKDALLVIDDFAPQGSSVEIARYHSAADRVFRAVGNQASRGRLDASAKLRDSKPPRGPSKGENRLSKKEAEVERDKFLATINKSSIQEKVADGMAMFSKMVEKYRAAHVAAQVAGRFLLAKPTRLKYILHLEQRIVPRWGSHQLREIKPDEVQQWLFDTCESWHMMNDLRGILSGIFTKAEDWGYWPEGRRNPMSRVKIGEKWSVRPERILTETETVRVLARLSDPNLLVLETAIATGARISEILGLQWCHVDLQNGVLRIAQRNWRGDIDDPKSKTSKRQLTLGFLVDRYRAKAAACKARSDNWVFVRTDGSNLPLWDSGVRQALKRAAAAEGCDFQGLGPHAFRRANITWRQEVGASSIEASKIAGHSTVRMTGDYTKTQLNRQDELTRRLQERLASVGAKQPAVVQ